MKLTYATTFEDFRQLQPPFTLQAGRNPGLKGALVACVLIGLLGVFCLAKGFGFSVGAFLIGLGGVAAILAYGYDVRAVRKAKQEYDHKIDTAYNRLHCRDRRVFEADEIGFTTSCQCGTVTRPWSELTGFSETESHLAVATKMGWQILPKFAFPSQGELTEFRSLVTTKLNDNRPATSRFFDIQHKREDFRQAYVLHTFRGGGWRGTASALLRYACIGGGVFVLANNMKSANRVVLFGVIGILGGIQLLQFVGNRRKHYLGPLRVYFGDTGLHLEDPRSQSRHSWSQFIGYLEDAQLMLLYHNPRLYRIVPKRALVGQSLDFLALVRAKLPLYDYRHPMPKFSMPPQPESHRITTA